MLESFERKALCPQFDVKKHLESQVIQKTATEYDVIVIGAGPGGLSAAKAAMEQGAAVTMKAAMDSREQDAACTAARADTRARAHKATCEAANHRPFRVAVLERDEIPGGILNQCVHDGFGIVRYGAQLSGPEYGEIEAAKAGAAGVEILTGYMVTEITTFKERTDNECNTAGFAADDSEHAAGFLVTAISRQGREQLWANSVVLATGCRERTRGMISIPGTRPAGIFTAGVAQNLINRRNVMVGHRVVILGSGDIGLIMARRLTLEGAQVLCVAEILPEPAGLARNVRQCLFDYGIPLYLNTTVSNICGKGRVEAVELSRVKPSVVQEQTAGQPAGELSPKYDAHSQTGERAGVVRELQRGETLRIDCDTLILSVGLIPENEVAKTAGVVLDPKTGGAQTDDMLQTSVPGIFACGNARAVMDLADFVSEQGEAAGRNAAAHALYQPLQKWEMNPHNVARKGMPEEGSVTCTLCPKGCQIKITPVAGADGLTNQRWIVSGNGCPRGEIFARQELTDPHRILTTTMRIAGTNRLLPVRSDRPIPLGEMRELAGQLRETVLRIDTGVKTGDVLIRGLGSEGANIIAEASY